MKKLLALCLCLLLVCSVFAACNDNVHKELTEDTTDSTAAPAKTATLTALLSTPSQAALWDEIAQSYREKTGVTVRVTTVSADTYPAALAKQLKGHFLCLVFVRSFAGTAQRRQGAGGADRRFRVRIALQRRAVRALFCAERQGHVLQLHGGDQQL